LSYRDSSAALTQWKAAPEHAFLREVSSVPLQQTLRYLQRAFVNFFSRSRVLSSAQTKRGNQSAEFTKSAFSWDQLKPQPYAFQDRQAASWLVEGDGPGEAVLR
jgi:putative transposase